MCPVVVWGYRAYKAYRTIRTVQKVLEVKPPKSAVKPSKSFTEAPIDNVGVVRNLSLDVLDVQTLKAEDTSKTGTKDGDRAGKDFTSKGKKEVINANEQKNADQTVCEDCGTNTVPAKKSQKGVKPPRNETQVDHIYPKSKGGDGSPSNGQVLCRDCNRKKGNNTPDKHYKNGGN